MTTEPMSTTGQELPSMTSMESLTSTVGDDGVTSTRGTTMTTTQENLFSTSSATTIKKQESTTDPLNEIVNQFTTISQTTTVQGMIKMWYQ